MGWWSRRKASRTDGGAVVSDRHASRADLDALREFARTRNGVEAFLEPQTSVTQQTLLLVAADGEWTRRRVASPRAAADLARKLEIPVYDANLVGYPQRMRDYNLRQQRPSSSSGQPSRPTLTTPTAPPLTLQEQAAVMALETIAGIDPLPEPPSRDDLLAAWKRARSNAHPDRRGGDRTSWDKVEQAARVLGLDRG